MFYLLLLTDVAFIAIDILFSTDYKSLFSIVKDFGYAEVYQYIKEFWIAALLVVLAISHRQLVFFAWALLFTFFLFDDSLQIHETFGRKLANLLEVKPLVGLSAHSLGELLVAAVAGGVLFSAITISYLFSNAVAKQISKYLLFCVMGIVFFGVVVDSIHPVLPGTIGFWSKVEDGGEMIVMSLVLAYVFSLDIVRNSDP